MNADDAVDEVLAAAPKEFVAARARAVARLQEAGDKAGAARVRALRRPSPSVWAVNQLAHREPDAVEELLAAGAALIAAERRALAGDGGNFLADARAERQRAAVLARRAEAILREAGQGASATTTRRIAQTLQAAAIGDDDMRAALRAGRLTADLDLPTGFASTSPQTSPSPSRTRSGRGGATAPPALREYHNDRDRAQLGRSGARGENAHDEPTVSPNRKAARTKFERTRTMEQKRARERSIVQPARGRADLERAAEGTRSARGQPLEHSQARKRGSATSRHDRERAAAERKRDRERVAAERKRDRERVAAERKRDRERAAGERKRARTAAASARRHHAALQRAAATAERAAVAHRRVVEHARAEVERAEQRLRQAKDDLAKADLAAQAARRAADDPD